VTKSGDCFARFNDGWTVFMCSRCQVVVEIDNQNKQTTRVIHFLSASLQRKVEQMVRIRNQHFSPVCYPSFMLKSKTLNKQQLLSTCTQSVWTPQCQHNMNVHDTMIVSSDGATQLKLHANRNALHIRYPVYIGKETKMTASGPLTYHLHIEQHTIESTCNHELCWDLPLTLIANKLQNRNPKQTAQLQQIETKICLPKAQTNNNNNKHSKTKLSQHTLDDILYFHCKNDDEHGVIPAQQACVVEWIALPPSPNATSCIVYRLFDGEQRVEIFNGFDDSYLITDGSGQFVHHYMADERNTDYVYAINAIPPIAPHQKQEDAYNLQCLVENALRLLSHTQTITRQQSQSQSQSQKRSLSSQQHMHPSCHIKDCYFDPKVGEFTCFDDKRVRINFCDRTILELNAQWTHCRIIDRYGEEWQQIDCVQPMQSFAKYIRSALNYAQWCSLTKTQQLQHQQAQAKIQSDIQKQLEFSQRVLQTQELTQTTDHIDHTQLLHDIQGAVSNIDRLLAN